jgi:KAP family P-loop domain
MSSDNPAGASRALLAVGTAVYASPDFEDLAHVPASLKTMVDTLTRLGYTTISGPPGYSVDPELRDLRASLRKVSGAAPTVVVYYTGYAAQERGTLYLINRASRHGDLGKTATSAVDLLEELNRQGGDHGVAVEHPSVLIVLDCIYSDSTAIELLSQVPTFVSSNTWVITSTGSLDNAQNGEFVSAFVQAIELLANMASPQQRFLDLESVVAEVNSKGRPRAVLFPPSTGSVGVPPFFPNPSYEPDLQRGSADTGPSQPPLGRDGSQLPRWSGSVQQVITYATALAGGQAVDATILFYASLRYSHQTSLPGITSGLLELLVARQATGTGPEALLDRAGGVLGTAPSSRVSPTVLGSESAQTVTPGSPTADVLNLASDLTRRITGDSRVHLRYLVLATVLAEPPLSPDMLNALGVSLPELRALLFQAAQASGEPVDAWRQILPGLPDAPSQPLREAVSEEQPGDAATAHPGFSDDLAGDLSADLVKPDEGIPADRDHLGMSTYVGMFASVIAYHKTPLPLSIGLFGEWGSGKSYFMGLLRDRVKTLAESKNPDYCHDIVQIGFNAWSYADSNLWASLGDEIFRELAGPTEIDKDERADVLNKELQEKLERATELKAAKKKAEDEATQLHADLAAARNDYSNSFMALVKATVQTSGSSILGEAWSRLGVKDDAKKVEILLDETRGASADAVALHRALGRRRLFLLGILGVVVGVGLLLASLWAGEAKALLSRVGATALVASAVFVTTIVRKVRSALQTVSAEAVRINARIEQNADKEFAEQVDAVRQANARREVVQAQLDEVLSRAGELGRELVDINPGQRLYGFLSERAASSDYRGRLGLISTIRKDFEKLIELMDEWRKKPDDKARRPIDRIVLYIDDLDRCSPEQVVDVLQAVHLLLALDLFVVVVGVDPRWLLHSLGQQYQRTLAADPTVAEADDETLWTSTPGDYLEKIFNIPFVLPAMTPGAFKTLIESLASSGPEEDLAGSSPGPDEVQSAAADGARPDVVREEPEAEMPAEDSSASASAAAAPAAQPAEPLLHAEAGSEVASQEAAVPGTEGNGAATPIPRPRPMTDDELKLIYALAPMVGTPREAKRLLNLYRMLRSTRNLSGASRFLGSDGEPGQYQAAAVLLGLLTAYPRLLGQMLWAAPEQEQRLAGGLCMRTRDEMTWAQFLGSLEPEEKDGQWRNAVSSDLSEAERDQWSRLVSDARPSAGLVQLPDLSAFRYWGDHVTRFSFLLSTIGAAPSPDG